MPSDETRRLLRTFGVAVTTYEDKVAAGAPDGEVRAAGDDARARFEEIAVLLERLHEAARSGRRGAGA